MRPSEDFSIYIIQQNQKQKTGHYYADQDSDVSLTHNLSSDSRLLFRVAGMFRAKSLQKGRSTRQGR